MKKLFAFILALAMTLALTVPAFATTPRGKGYTDGTVNVGNYDYPVTIVHIIRSVLSRFQREKKCGEYTHNLKKLSIADSKK